MSESAPRRMDRLPYHLEHLVLTLSLRKQVLTLTVTRKARAPDSVLIFWASMILEIVAFLR